MSSVLLDKATKPDDTSLSKALGKSKPHWDAIIARVVDEHPELTREWKFYGAKHGWQLRIARKKAVVLYMIPHQGSFLAALALKEPALAVLRSSGFLAGLVAEIDGAKANVEGRPARIEVTRKGQVDIVLRLLELKLIT